MDDAQVILDYLPISYRNKEKEQYVGLLRDSCVSNYETERIEFASLRPICST